VRCSYLCVCVWGGGGARQVREAGGLPMRHIQHPSPSHLKPHKVCHRVVIPFDVRCHHPAVQTDAWLQSTFAANLQAWCDLPGSFLVVSCRTALTCSSGCVRCFERPQLLSCAAILRLRRRLAT